VKNPSNPKVAEYLEAENYQINQDRLNASRAASVVQVIMSVVGLVGLLFIGLSFVIFTMNFRVILAEAKNEIQLLLQLGYTSAMISSYLLRYFARLIIGISLLSCVLLYVSHYFTSQFLSDKGLEVSSNIEPVVWVVAFALVLLMFGLNVSFLRNILRKYA
jgi:hypothetical protein